MSAISAAACSMLAAAQRKSSCTAAESCGTPALCPSAAIISPTTSLSACARNSEAERIKRQHGLRSFIIAYRRQPIQIASVGDRPPRTIFARQLTDIIEPARRNCLP